MSFKLTLKSLRQKGVQCFHICTKLFKYFSYNKKVGIVGKILKSAYTFHLFVFKNSFKKVKKNEEENLLLLIERSYGNDFYIIRKLNNRAVQKYTGLNINFISIMRFEEKCFQV